MEIVRIFAKSFNLCTVQYKDKDCTEFNQLMEQWHSPEYLFSFFDQHKTSLESGFWGSQVLVINAIEETEKAATIFEEKIMKALKSQTLDEFFNPLSDIKGHTSYLSKSKAKQYWLRIYALKIESNHYVITGGAIKLTRTMQEAEHTNKELTKLSRVRAFLELQGIVDKEGIEEIILDI